MKYKVDAEADTEAEAEAGAVAEAEGGGAVAFGVNVTTVLLAGLITEIDVLAGTDKIVDTCLSGTLEADADAIVNSKCRLYSFQ